MAAVVTYDADSPGRGGSSPVSAMGSRRIKQVTGKLSFDNSYPTGGEDIAEIFNFFTELKGLVIEDPALSAGTGKKVVIDYTAKKAKLVTNAATPAEVADTSDQSGAVNLHFFAWGV